MQARDIIGYTAVATFVGFGIVCVSLTVFLPPW